VPLAVVTVVVSVAVLVSVTVVGVVTVLVSVTVFVGCLTVTLADCEVVAPLSAWVADEVTVLAPTPATDDSTNATARPATKATSAAAQAHERRG